MASSTWWSVALGLSHWWTCEAGRWRRSGTAHHSRSHPPRALSRSPCGPDGTECLKNSQESKRQFLRNLSLRSTHPLANGGAPAHNAALQPGVRPNPRSLQHRAAFYPHPVLHNHAGTNGDIWPDGAVLSDLCRRVLQWRAGMDGVLESARFQSYVKHRRAELTTKTLPRNPGPVRSLSGVRCRSDWRYMHIPVRKSLGWPMSIQKPAGGHTDRQTGSVQRDTMEVSKDRFINTNTGLSWKCLKKPQLSYSGKPTELVVSLSYRHCTGIFLYTTVQSASRYSR